MDKVLIKKLIKEVIRENAKAELEKIKIKEALKLEKELERQNNYILCVDDVDEFLGNELGIIYDSLGVFSQEQYIIDKIKVIDNDFINVVKQYVKNIIHLKNEFLKKAKIQNSLEKKKCCCDSCDSCSCDSCSCSCDE